MYSVYHARRLCCEVTTVVCGLIISAPQTKTQWRSSKVDRTYMAGRHSCHTTIDFLVAVIVVAPTSLQLTIGVRRDRIRIPLHGKRDFLSDPLKRVTKQVPCWRWDENDAWPPRQTHQDIFETLEVCGWTSRAAWAPRAS